jgi:hypothetical protein
MALFVPLSLRDSGADPDERNPSVMSQLQEERVGRSEKPNMFDAYDGL